MRIIPLLNNYIVPIKLDGKQPKVSIEVKVHNMIKMSVFFIEYLLARVKRN